MFEPLLEQVTTGGSNVRTYSVCVRQARARMDSEPDNAAALFLIAYAAQRFVDSYHDQPLTVEAASDELKQFSAMVKLLSDAFSGKSADARNAALNQAALQIATSAKS